MRIEAAAGTPIIVTHSGGSSSFPPLRIRHLAALCAQRRAENRHALVKRLEESGADAKAKFAALAAFDEELYHDGHLARECFTPAGAMAVLVASIRVTKPDATEADLDLLPLTMDEYTDVALAVMGTRRAKKGEGDGENGNPPKAAVAATG